MKPEYKNCQLNLIASIEKHYGDKTQHFAPIPEIDELLVGKKHIFLIVLDGLGTRLVEENLSEHSFIREHYFKTMSTLYPSTTTCVTIALRSGKLPNDTGFYAWHKDQNLSLNSMKISGQCGRLLCCLSYEYDWYAEARRKLPNEGVKFFYDGTTFRVMESNPLTTMVKMIGDDGRILEIPVSRMKYIDGKWKIVS